MKDQRKEQERISSVYSGRDDEEVQSRYRWFKKDVVLAEFELNEVLTQCLNDKFPDSFENIRVLDVGCGTGGFIRKLIGWGVKAENITGTELLEGRIADAKVKIPDKVNWHLGMLDTLDNDKQYDLVSAFTVFSSILSHDLRKSLINEMWDKLEHGGWLLIYDFRFDNPNNKNVKKVTKSELGSLVNGENVFYRTLNLAPPIARRIAPISMLLAYVLGCLPFLRTHFIYMVQKT